MSGLASTPLDPGRLLSGVGVEQFFADYWQRRAVTLQLAAEDFARLRDEIGPLDIVRFAQTAREGTRAWIANDYVAHSVVPVDASNASQFFEIGATLYFLNVPLPRLTDAFADFLGAPREKVIASLFLTPANGGASPHFDKNENFTVQLSGAKRWKVGETPVVSAPADGYIYGQKIPESLIGLLPKEEPPRRQVELRPGTLLYVPRGTVHATEAGEISWSLNLSYSPSMWLDLVRIALRRRLGRSERWRGSVTGIGGGPAMRGNILAELTGELRDLLSDPQELDALARDFLNRPYD
jgi:ribosomal protein L16 Arg81 hydroxylase